MNRFIAAENLTGVLKGTVSIPTITMWNRLEGRPRAHDFKRALQAEIRDPLWMLTKQWQMGEFLGDDAGSPTTAKVHLETTELTQFKAAENPVEAFDDDVPLEAKVEQRPIPFVSGGQIMSLDIRLQMGRRWLKLIAGIEPGLRAKFIEAVEFSEPDGSDRDQMGVVAHREVWQAVAAVAGRAMDGFTLYQHLTTAVGNHAHDFVALEDADSTLAIEAAETTFLAWYDALYYQPDPEGESAWLPEKLEYSFEASAPKGDGQKHLVADEYFHGHLDWYNLDISPDGNGLGENATESGIEASHTASFIPAPIQFDGMPNTRWWQFEEGRTSFGDIDPDTTDVNKLLLIEFGLIYANDWFLMPFTVPAGTIANVIGMTVSNVFGERTWVTAAGSGLDDDWQRWSMFTLATKGRDDVVADQSLVVVPSVPKIQESAPLETVNFVRDEMANMVWGIETRVPLPTGESKSGRSAARDSRRFHKRVIADMAPDLPADPILENDATVRYQLMTRVPENWIPFVPVHVEGSTREVQLRRAAMPRVITGDPEPPRKIRPRSDLLREGIDEEPAQVYDVHEQEVRRAGTKVSQSFQRSRWYGGEVFVWRGARKQTGRGERSSGLSFDRIRPKR